MPSRSLPRIARVPTHVPGLDTVLCGGFLRGGIYVVRGAPGSGKTILGNQICFENARRGGSSAYVTLLAESHARMMLHLESVDFFYLELAGDSVRYLSAYGMLFSMAACVLVSAVFVIWPLIGSIQYSFYRWHGVSQRRHTQRPRARSLRVCSLLRCAKPPLDVSPRAARR